MVREFKNASCRRMNIRNYECQIVGNEFNAEDLKSLLREQAFVESLRAKDPLIAFQ
jgi:hypothetical protein